jgi:dTMP kinase
MSMFITFEGIEGSGKTYQSKVLYQKLVEAGKDCILAYEPGGTALGREIRKILKKDLEDDIAPETELFLFSACRTQLLKEVIVPALARDKVVVCDRFSDSTIAYQGYGRGINLGIVSIVNQLSTDGLEPEMTILIDLPVEDSLRRKGDRANDRFDSEDVAFHTRVREGFLNLAKDNADRWLVIDGLKTRSQISQEIWEKVKPLLK